MTEGSIYEGLTDIVREIFGDDAIVLDARTTAADIRGWDSINNLNIIVAAERRDRLDRKCRRFGSDDS